MDTGDLVLAVVVAVATLCGAGLGGALTILVAKREHERHQAAEQRESRLAARLISSDLAGILASVNQALREKKARHAQLKVDLATTWREHRAGLADLTTPDWDTVDAAIAYVAEFPWRQPQPVGTEVWSDELEQNLTDLRPALQAAFDVLRRHVD
jgi:hypothetical protein